MMGGRSSRHLGEGRSQGQSGEHCGERLLHRSTPASGTGSARIVVVASPLASHPRLRTARHALCCAASHSCIGPAPSSGLASADEPGGVLFWADLISKNTCQKVTAAHGLVSRLCIPCCGVVGPQSIPTCRDIGSEARVFLRQRWCLLARTKWIRPLQEWIHLHVAARVT